MRHLLVIAGAALVLGAGLSGTASAGPREEENAAVAACRAAVSVQAPDQDTVRFNRVNRHADRFDVRFRLRNDRGFTVSSECVYDRATQRVASVDGVEAVTTATAAN